MVLLAEEIKKLKQEKDAVILSHYYVDSDVKQIADRIGDSYYLAEEATKVPNRTIVLCGVTFMGESVKLLNPEKTVLLADRTAACPMAAMYSIEEIKNIRRQYDDVAVVCYINSTAELKSYSDVTVTSANALQIVRSLPNKNIYFVPDENLGKYVASQVPEKNFLFYKGFCHVHAAITASEVTKLKQEHPAAQVLVHPECRQEVISLADYVGSTSGMLRQAASSGAEKFIVCTEGGILYDLQNRNPEKKFYFPGYPLCYSMKKITLEGVRDALLTGNNEVTVDGMYAENARASLRKMLELSRS
jgi:quinolinate synthetase complex, A subunit